MLKKFMHSLLRHEATISPACVLVIEDSMMILRPLLGIIRDAGFHPIPAMNLAEVHHILGQGQPIFAAVADYCLPDAAEGEVLPVLIKHQIPTIALTAHTDANIRDKILSMSVVDYVPKESPAALEYVVRILNRLQRNPKIGVLVVDDSSSMRNYLRHLLERQHYRVIDAESAQGGLDILSQDTDIRLVLTDQDMPGMDGMRFATEIRRRYGYNALSIIGVSGVQNSVISARFIKAGADDFIHKPFNHEEFFCRITRNIEFIENVQALERTANLDPLTGLSNRRHFLSQAEKLKGEYVIAIADIDFFKKVNDTYGHDIGDLAIQTVAHLIKQSFEDGFTARFGGEEFVICLDSRDIQTFVARLNALREALAVLPISTPQGDLLLHISVGAAFCSAGRTIPAGLKQADEALYAAKQQGRNQVCVH